MLALEKRNRHKQDLEKVELAMDSERAEQV